MITYEIIILCDLCPSPGPKGLFASTILESPDVDAARKEAWHQGWTFSGAACICPKCGENDKAVKPDHACVEPGCREPRYVGSFCQKHSQIEKRTIPF